MPTNFVAIDVETANADMSSICQIGVAKFIDGQLNDQWTSLIDPEDDFDWMNISIHGIEPRMVRGQPTFPQIADKLRSLLNGSISVCHTNFDRLAVNRAVSKYSLNPIETVWLDSARVVRRTWDDLAWKGYGLANVCERLGYDFQHHDALADAKAAGHVLLAALEESKLDLDAWLHRVALPIDPSNSSRGNLVERDGNPEGDLFGEVVVFTGALEMPRSEAANTAAAIGCKVDQGVTKKTTILVVGDQDISKLAGKNKSSKHIKAEQLISDGYPIRIIQESDFKELVRLIP
jgi:DNA polymerase-3 subunit epsilon